MLKYNHMVSYILLKKCFQLDAKNKHYCHSYYVKWPLICLSLFHTAHIVLFELIYEHCSGGPIRSMSINSEPH